MCLGFNIAGKKDQRYHGWGFENLNNLAVTTDITVTRMMHEVDEGFKAA